jgi:DNA-binding beta-propeller fold protein YncE
MAVSCIAFESSPDVHDVISGIGRTEDIRLSPDGKRLAVVDFSGNRVFIFLIRIDQTFATPRITLLEYSVISSASLDRPHGVAFLGDEHVIVCNRNAGVDVFRIPPTGSDRRERDVKPLKTINGKGLLLAKVKSPGSVDCYKISDNCYRVLVCNNYWHIVTLHIVRIGSSIQIQNKGVLIENGLKLPDGVCCSSDHAWIAISNPVSGEVLVYKNCRKLNRKTPPAATLRGIVCPHGVRFSPDGRRVFVADSASPYLHIFENEQGVWHGSYTPVQLTRLLDDEAFHVGRNDYREGGIKGIEIDSSGKLLVTTRGRDVIRFYDLSEILAEISVVNQKEIDELCVQRDRSFEQKRGTVLNQRWTIATRIGLALFAQNRWRGFKRKVRLRRRMWPLYLRNRWSKQTILDPSGPVLSLTTHGCRLELVFYAIQSIGTGSRKPSRITLWLQDKDAYLNPPDTLRRLMLVGLEICLSEDLGPHTKYYPYIDRESELYVPLVTADDDVMYPVDWLQNLIAAHEANPVVVHCHRAQRMRLNNKRFLPYNTWEGCQSTSPSHLNFIIAVCGVIYPPDFLQYLKNQGRGFEHCCSAADDIWMTVNALRGGFKIAQVTNRSAHVLTIPGSQKQRLSEGNVLAGGNQYQLRDTFTESDLAELRTHLSSEESACEGY